MFCNITAAIIISIQEQEFIYYNCITIINETSSSQNISVCQKLRKKTLHLCQAKCEQMDFWPSHHPCVVCLVVSEQFKQAQSMLLNYYEHHCGQTFFAVTGGSSHCILVLVRTVGTSPTTQPAAPMPIAAIQPASLTN